MMMLRVESGLGPPCRLTKLMIARKAFTSTDGFVMAVRTIDSLVALARLKVRPSAKSVRNYCSRFVMD